MARIGDRGEMEAFVRSVELGSFSAAARELGLTPSTLSKLVTRLEQALKVRLVKRSPRQIVPTPEGELFVVRCRRVLAELEDAETEVSRSRDRPRGKLRMHTGPGFGMTQLLFAMPRFLERCPEVQVDLMLEDRRVDLLRENLDISVTVWKPENLALVVRKLFDFGRITCAAPSYLKRYGTPRTLDELARHRCIRVASTLGTMPWRFQTPAGTRTIEAAPDLVVNNASFGTQLVMLGAGVAQMMEFQVAEAIRDGRLIHLFPEYPCPDELSMLAVYSHERHRLPRVRAMLDFLVTTFASRPWRTASRPRTRSR
jgi:DNA-binding transcriptional LysR family regulator